MNLAIITARSGSKGLPDKNIKLLNGKPLMAYTIEAALKSKYFDEVMVSTDSSKYAEIAKKNGAKVPFLRSPYTSSDTATTKECVEEVLGNYRKLNKNFERFMILQPTSPLRDEIDIQNAFKLFKEKDAKSIVSVVELEHPMQWCNSIDETLSLENFLTPEGDCRRQNLQTHYRLNGAIYLHDTKHYLSTDNIFDDAAFALIMEKHKSIDIDTLIDFELCEFFLCKTKGSVL